MASVEEEFFKSLKLSLSKEQTHDALAANLTERRLVTSPRHISRAFGTVSDPLLISPRQRIDCFRFFENREIFPFFSASQCFEPSCRPDFNIRDWAVTFPKLETIVFVRARVLSDGT